MPSKLSPILVHALADLETRVEAKVKAATTAATATGFVVSLISVLVLHGGAVPAVISSAIGALVTGGLTFGAGYLARHTPRTPSAPPAVVSTPAASPAAPVTPVVPPTPAP